LAPRPFVLSGQILAYNGHIRASSGHPTAYGLFRQAAGPTRQPPRVPILPRQSLFPMPPSVLRWSPRRRTTLPSSRVLPSPHSHGHGDHKPHQSGSSGWRNEAPAFAWCYGLEKPLALLRPGLLRPSRRGAGYPCAPRRLPLDPVCLQPVQSHRKLIGRRRRARGARTRTGPWDFSVVTHAATLSATTRRNRTWFSWCTC
jgi:hypothetical protein